MKRIKAFLWFLVMCLRRYPAFHSDPEFDQKWLEDWERAKFWRRQLD